MVVRRVASRFGGRTFVETATCLCEMVGLEVSRADGQITVSLGSASVGVEPRRMGE